MNINKRKSSQKDTTISFICLYFDTYKSVPKAKSKCFVLWFFEVKYGNLRPVLFNFKAMIFFVKMLTQILFLNKYVCILTQFLWKNTFAERKTHREGKIQSILRGFFLLFNVSRQVSCSSYRFLIWVHALKLVCQHIFVIKK